MDQVESLLKKLSESFGPSGFEDPVRKIMNQELSKYTNSIYTDGLGSLISEFKKETDNPKVMITAHMDEVGLLVKYIDDEGYIRFQQLGGWLDSALLGQRWQISTKKGIVFGISGIKTPHVMNPEERKKTIPSDEIFIDVGAINKEDAEKNMGIDPGDPIAPLSEFKFLGNKGLYVGKAWDDRIGLAVMIQIAKSLHSNFHPNKLFLVSTVQELSLIHI